MNLQFNKQIIYLQFWIETVAVQNANKLHTGNHQIDLPKKQFRRQLILIHSSGIV